MADIKQVIVKGMTYDVKDEIARESVENLAENISILESQVEAVQGAITVQ